MFSKILGKYLNVPGCLNIFQKWEIVPPPPPPIPPYVVILPILAKVPKIMYYDQTVFRYYIAD